MTMLINHFKIAWRNLRKDRRFTFLNLLGLSTGLACTFLIYLWVNDELHVDRFFQNDTRLFQVMVRDHHSNGISVAPQTPALLSDALATELPDVEYAAAVQAPFAGRSTLSVGDKLAKASSLYVTKDYLHVFSWRLVDGNKDQALADKSSIVLTRALATQLFGTTDKVVGKKVEWQHQKQFVVSAIVDDPPATSSTKFDFLLPFELFLDENSYEKDWNNSDPNTYVMVRPGTDIARLDDKMKTFIKTKHKKANKDLFLRRYSDAYLYGSYENGIQSGGRIEYVRLFSVIALFILIIACINFMNLATAKASRRMKEVGIRKCIGASRRTLIFQYLGESVLMAFCSLAIAILMVAVILPAFSGITGKQLALHASPGIAGAFLGITLFAGILAGSYPALYLSGFKPVAVLKGRLRHSISELLVREGLVVFQFTLSVVFIISAMVVYKQIAFIQNKDKGFDKDNVVSFSAEGSLDNINEFVTKMQTLLTEVKNTSGVVSASSLDHNSMVADYGTTGDISWPGKKPEDKITFGNIGINYGLIETLDMKMVAGRSFSRALSSDSSEIIFNETAIKAMGLKDPIGQTVRMWDQNRKIVGIVKDFHYASLHENVQPFALRLEPVATYRIMARIRAGAEQPTLAHLQQLYKKYYPGFTFDYQFLDQDYQAQYVAERQVAQLSLWFTALTVLIACLGLFGLAAFMAERRFKEIGIRKVLGASVNTVVLLLSKDFLKLIGIAILAAFPLAWWATSHWLSGFAYRVDIGAGIFVLAAVLIILITMITTGFQSIKAALANPVKILRSE